MFAMRYARAPCGSPPSVIRRIADGGGGSLEMYNGFDVGDVVMFEGLRNAFYLGMA